MVYFLLSVTIICNLGNYDLRINVSHVIVANVGYLVVLTKNKVALELEDAGYFNVRSLDLSDWYEWAFNEILRRNYSFEIKKHDKHNNYYLPVFNSLEHELTQGFINSLGLEASRAISRLCVTTPIRAILSNETLFIITTSAIYV